jgi:hypothetical protein
MLNDDIHRRRRFADSAEPSYAKLRQPPAAVPTGVVMWDDFDGYYCEELRDLNATRINWNAKNLNCDRCTFAGAVPTAGSYGSTLQHFERVMGELSGKRENVRCMVIFQDPREDEANFVASSPHKDPALVGPGEMRYFGMNTTAWQSLGLNLATGDKNPSWPSEENAHHYLRRYFGRGPKSWSYEGIISYFIYLFRPSKAYITNHAKCHFGQKGQIKQVFRN